MTWLCPALLLALLLATGGCSERKKKPLPKAKAAATARAPVQKVHCGLAPGAVTERGVAGVELGQPVEPINLACRAAKLQGGRGISPSLKEAQGAIWLVTGKDTVRVLTYDKRIVEVDALTPGFVTPDSLRVGNTLQQVLRRRPNAAKDGQVQILQNQLTVGDRRCGGILAVLSDAMQGQQIGLTPEEVSRLPGSLRVKRLAVIPCKT